jgi:porphobilinogen deaminase
MILGTRGSALALAQTRIVADALRTDVEIRVVRTAGDISSRPLPELGDGVFVTAIEEALRAGEIDAAVHSLKDLPTGERPCLVVGARIHATCSSRPRAAASRRSRVARGSAHRARDEPPLCGSFAPTS